MTLKRESSIPIYQQVADDITSTIRDLNMEKGNRLLTEYELVEKYQVSRATIRKAIAQLVSKNIIDVSPGKGMFVKNPVIDLDFNELRGIYEILTAQGLETYTKLIKYEKVIPPLNIVENLKLSKEDVIYSIQRIYYIDKQPLAFSTAYFPSEVEFTVSQVEEMKIYGLMQNKLNISLDQATYKISACTATSTLNEILQNESNNPFLKMERTTFCTKNIPRESTVAYFCSDKYQFNFNISNNGELKL